MTEQNNTGHDVKTFIASCRMGEAQHSNNVTVIPLLSELVIGNGYTLLQEGIETGKVQVVEVTESGHIPELKVVNELDNDVIILEGEELIGAKQNRIVNVTLIIGSRRTVVIPVSCVEQGRWRYSRADFKVGSSHPYVDLRRKKTKAVTNSLRDNNSFVADQGEIWRDISMKAQRFSVHSETGAMQNIFEKAGDRIQESEENFTISSPDQVGFVVLINGKVVGCDIFGSKEVIAKVHKRLLKGYLLDAAERDFGRRGHKTTEDTQNPYEKVKTFLEMLSGAKLWSHPSLGEGTDMRFEEKKLTGFALIHKEQVVHLAAFVEPNPAL
ncbi:MAG: hypothetical protein FJ110_09630 [Deltaproteobacteria bacterium]|nr:hypothetical protein [Deltaproteobacteria bacterium]